MTTDAPLGALIDERFGTTSTRALDRNETVAVLLRHRVHRKYSDRPVDEATLDVILAAALSAPSKSDLQQVALIVVRDAAKRDAIAAPLPSMPWVRECPVFLVVCGDNRRLRRVAQFHDKPFPNDTLDMFMNAAVDAALCMQNLLVAAEALGLGCCPISHVRNDVEGLSELLSLPPFVFPVAGMCLGYPAGEGTVSMRLPSHVTVHVDRYDDASLAAEVRAYDERREARGPTPPDRQRYVDRYGIAVSYGWSEDKARQYSVPERHGFGSYVRAQGFSLR